MALEFTEVELMTPHETLKIICRRYRVLLAAFKLDTMTDIQILQINKEITVNFRVTIQGVSGGIVNILGGCSIDYSE
jgi:hypothetical protein